MCEHDYAKMIHGTMVLELAREKELEREKLEKEHRKSGSRWWVFL